MKRVLVAIAVLVVVGLVLPLSNLVVGPPMGVLAAPDAAREPEYAKAAALFTIKCVNCHSTAGKLPFYAALPVARDLIAEDITRGTRFFDMAAALDDPSRPAPEAALAMIELVTVDGAMPPLRYRMLHWDGGLNAAERAVVLAWIHRTRVDHYAVAGLPAELQTQAIQPLPASARLDEAKVALGNRLFHDVRLSGDDSISCASCHALDKGGTDQAPFSTGIRKQLGGINSPTVYNAVFATRQFWDGRAADLKEQANGPVNNPIEMGSSWPETIAKLAADRELVAAYNAVYPGELNSDDLTDAIATFEASLVTPGSRFDKFLLGDTTALTEEEQHGWTVFTDSGCQTCHVGKAMGGQSFELMGRFADYFATRGNRTEADLGRYNFTKQEVDRGKFKVPTLRNLTATFPYFHDGTATTIEQAVATMVSVQTDASLSDRDRSALAAFLRTLTGEYAGQLVQ